MFNRSDNSIPCFAGKSALAYCDGINRTDSLVKVFPADAIRTGGTNDAFVTDIFV
jgi:hypothetical protein